MQRLGLSALRIFNPLAGKKPIPISIGIPIVCEISKDTYDRGKRLRKICTRIYPERTEAGETKENMEHVWAKCVIYVGRT